MKFECKDMGMDCDFVATAESKAEVMELAMAHAAEIHSEVLMDLTTEQADAMNAQLEAVIREDAVAEDAAGEEDEIEEGDEEKEAEGEEETDEVA